MDNDDEIVGRILSRRELLALFGAAGLAMTTGCGGSGGASAGGTNSGTGGAPNLIVTPAVTEGPFFVDENLSRSNLLAGTSRPSVLNGTPLALKLAVSKISGGATTPLTGAHVDIWHTDAVGKYSDEASEGTAGQTWLRGYQVTDANRTVNFATIYPGWYAGRTVHIHFKVRLYSASGAKTYEFTLHLFFSDALSDSVFAAAPYNTRGTRQVRNANDGIYNSRLLLSVAKAASGTGYAATFNVGLQMS